MEREIWLDEDEVYIIEASKEINDLRDEMDILRRIDKQGSIKIEG
jgi:hypothetical protein